MTHVQTTGPISLRPVTITLESGQEVELLSVEECLRLYEHMAPTLTMEQRDAALQQAAEILFLAALVRAARDGAAVIDLDEDGEIKFLRGDDGVARCESRPEARDERERGSSLGLASGL